MLEGVETDNRWQFCSSQWLGRGRAVGNRVSVLAGGSQQWTVPEGFSEVLAARRQQGCLSSDPRMQGPDDRGEMQREQSSASSLKGLGSRQDQAVGTEALRENRIQGRREGPHCLNVAGPVGQLYPDS